MPRTNEELQELKEEFETLNNKLKELTEEELKFVLVEQIKTLNMKV